MNKTTFTSSDSKNVISDTASPSSTQYTDILSSLTPEELERLNSSFRQQTTDQFSASSYRDPYQTHPQQERDDIITNLLRAYYDSYIDKRRTKIFCQKVILGICASSILGSVVGLLFLTHQFVFHPQNFSDLNAVVGFVTAFASFFGLVFGLVTIITKFAFPKNDEEYITTIVKAIQENDFNTIVESHRSQPSSPEHNQSESSDLANCGIVGSDNDL